MSPSLIETPTTFMVFSIVILFLIRRLWLKTSFEVNQASPSYIPGPRGISPSVVSSQQSYRTFHILGQKYGPVFSIDTSDHSPLGRLVSFFFGRPPVMIIITTAAAATAIMQKRGEVLIDRPRYVAAGEILSRGMRLLLMSSGERLTRSRRELQIQFKPSSITSYEAIQLRGARKLVQDIILDPSQHQVHAKVYAASLMLSMTYGKVTPTTYADPEITSITRILHRLGAASKPGMWQVERFPFLRYIPGYTSSLDSGHSDDLSVFLKQLSSVKIGMDDHGAESTPQSLVKSMLLRQNEHGLSDAEMAYLAGSMFNAGSDTTAAVISTVILCAACFPLAQDKVQREIDAIIGSDRVPSFRDQESLPHLAAFVLECMRWRPASASGFPHRAGEDIIWGDYCIPKGATVVGNHWSICHDGSVYSNPDAFDAERWLDPNGCLLPDSAQKLYFYGFGRRVCPGRHLADRSIFITTVFLLWAFKIRQVEGFPIDVDAFEGFIGVRPLPFQAHFFPRVKSFDHIKEVLEL